MEPKGSLPPSQKHTTGLYPEPDESNLHPHTLVHSLKNIAHILPMTEQHHTNFGPLLLWRNWKQKVYEHNSYTLEALYIEIGNVTVEITLC
jgi:hypothetical protein